MRTEPPVSEPMAQGRSFAATAAPLPDDEPPGTCATALPFGIERRAVVRIEPDAGIGELGQC